VAVDHHRITRRAAEQLVDRHVQRLAEQIPQRGIDRRNRRHRDRTAPPVRAFVEVLPDVFDPARVAANQERNDVVAQVTADRQLAAVQRGVAQAGQPVLGGELERDELRPGLQTMTLPSVIFMRARAYDNRGTADRRRPFPR
jgi:hypothetical protein